MTKKLFPRKVMITQDIIDEANNISCINCIGAKTLFSIFDDKETYYLASWGSVNGTLYTASKNYKITTEEGINMMEVKKPMEVTLIYKK